MMATIKISPLTRIEGHLDIEINVEKVLGQDQVVDARVAGTMYRGFENILVGRDPRDAVHLTQRICGVCPISHATASSIALDSAFQATPPENGRLLRNLVLGSNFLQSHILHFYHLTLQDYVDTTGLLGKAPWQPRYITPDLISGSAARQLVDGYVKALDTRRKLQEMGAIFGARMPCSSTFVPGGFTEVATSTKIKDFAVLFVEVYNFISGVFFNDLLTLGMHFLKYLSIGRGCGNLLAYGAFEEKGGGKLFPAGRFTSGKYGKVDPGRIAEYVGHSRYTPRTSGLNPSVGVTEPDLGKTDAYSWIKAPRYEDVVHEVGPLARLWVAGHYRRGISVLDRLVARMLECWIISDGMARWLMELQPGKTGIHPTTVPPTGTGVALAEAPRGALGHWMEIRNSRLSRYQVLTPTAWNASPMDDAMRKGPMEQALVGTPIADRSQPIEALRVVHSFDPCLACSVHVLDKG